MFPSSSVFLHECQNTYKTLSEGGKFNTAGYNRYHLYSIELKTLTFCPEGMYQCIVLRFTLAVYKQTFALVWSFNSNILFISTFSWLITKLATMEEKSVLHVLTCFFCTSSHENLAILSDKHNVCRKEKGKKELKDRRQTQYTSAITWCGIESNINPNIYTRTTFSIRFTDSKI